MLYVKSKINQEFKFNPFPSDTAGRVQYAMAVASHQLAHRSTPTPKSRFIIENYTQVRFFWTAAMVSVTN
jgi:hypothetical protein